MCGSFSKCNLNICDFWNLCNLTMSCFNWLVHSATQEIFLWKHGDPIENQIKNSHNFYYFSKRLDELHLKHINVKRRTRSWIIVIICLISTFRFFALAVRDIPEDMALMVGSVQGHLTPIGRVMYLVLAFVSLESFWIRCVCIWMENKNQLWYLSSFLCHTLDGDPNADRTKKFLQNKFYYGEVMTTKFVSLVILYHFLTTISRLMIESSVISMFLWILWTTLNLLISTIAVLDYTNVCLLRYVVGGGQATRLITLFEEVINLVKCQDRRETKKLFTSVITKYTELKSYMTSSSRMAGKFVFPHNLCSTFVNGSLIFCLVNTKENYIILSVVAMITHVCVKQTMNIMTGAAKVTLVSRKIHRILSCLPNRPSHQFLTIKQKKDLLEVTKSIGNHRCPIAIRGAEGKIYDSDAVYENLSSTLLMVLQFLDLMRGDFSKLKYH